MQSFDFTILIPFVYVAMMLFMWLFPPRWVKQIFVDIDEQVSAIKTWTPRLMGALRGANPEQYVERAKTEGGDLLGLIVQLAQLAQHLPQLIDVANQLGLSSLIGGATEKSEGVVDW